MSIWKSVTRAWICRSGTPPWAHRPLLAERQLHYYAAATLYTPLWSLGCNQISFGNAGYRQFFNQQDLSKQQLRFKFYKRVRAFYRIGDILAYSFQPPMLDNSIFIGGNLENCTDLV
jgi:hypothetical protein